MNKASLAGDELRAMDELAAGSSPAHRLHPLVKLIVTVLYIAITVSFHKYDLTGLVPMVLYPVFMLQAAGLRLRTCFVKLRFVLPLVLAVGIINPFLDRQPLAYLGGLAISGGVISMLTLILKGVFSLQASFLLIATTRIDALCAALRQIHVPELLVSLLLLTFRFISVLIDQVSVMGESYALRAPGQKGLHFSAWGSFLGQLLLRSMDRASELYHSMLLRGYDGRFIYARPARFRASDLVFAAVCAGCFALLRCVNIASLLGGLFVR